MVFKWDDTWSVSIRSFDEHHRKLVGILNRLVECVDSKDKADVQCTGKIFEELMEYTVYHFADEEAAMEKHGYPEISSHREEHNDLALKVKFFHKAFQDGQVQITKNLVGMLKNWVEKHIKETDRRYAPFLKDKGML